MRPALPLPVPAHGGQPLGRVGPSPLPLDVEPASQSCPWLRHLSPAEELRRPPGWWSWRWPGGEGQLHAGRNSRCRDGQRREQGSPGAAPRTSDPEAAWCPHWLAEGNGRAPRAVRGCVTVELCVSPCSGRLASNGACSGTLGLRPPWLRKAAAERRPHR